MTDQGYLEQPNLHVKAPYRAARLNYPGNMKQALADAKADPKKTLFGVAQGIPSVFVTKLLASTQPDFIWMDVEHAMFDRLALHDAIHAAQHHSEGKSLVVVRVPKGDPVTLSTALDAGASAIIFPHCESADEVKHLMKEVFYPPLGERSFSPWTFTPGISDQSIYADDPFNMKNSNNHILVIPQIESVKGVENLEEIASLPNIGGLMFGPGDFSADAGLPLKLGGEPHPTLMAAMMKMGKVAKEKGLPLFGAAQAPDMIPGLIAGGFSAIAVAFDYWGLTGLIHGALSGARATVANMGNEEAATNGTTNGEEKPATKVAVREGKPEEAA